MTDENNQNTTRSRLTLKLSTPVSTQSLAVKTNTEKKLGGSSVQVTIKGRKRDSKPGEDRDIAGLEAKDSLIIRYGHELLRDHHVSSATYAEAVSLFTQQGALEIAAVMGDYVLAAILLTAIDQQLPATTTPLLPDAGGE